MEFLESFFWFYSGQTSTFTKKVKYIQTILQRKQWKKLLKSHLLQLSTLRLVSNYSRLGLIKDLPSLILWSLKNIWSYRGAIHKILWHFFSLFDPCQLHAEFPGFRDCSLWNVVDWHKERRCSSTYRGPLQARGRGSMCPPVLGRLFFHYINQGGRLCPPNYYIPPPRPDF